MTLIRVIWAQGSFRGRSGLSLSVSESARVLLVAHLSFSQKKKQDGRFLRERLAIMDHVN